MSCHDHSERRKSPEALATAARQALEAAGQQWTPLRAAVFGALVKFDDPASAYDITEAVSKAEGRRLMPNSVYRILDLFTTTNVATRVESQNAFLANVHPLRRHDCIFLVCDGCGVTQHLDDDHAVDHVRAAASATGFRVDRPVIELRGRCESCLARVPEAVGDRHPAIHE